MVTGCPGKTPIQILHEYGTKTGKMPVYAMEKAEGHAHLPTFIFSVTVGSITCTGQGNSKKAAKHTAAEAALNILKEFKEDPDGVGLRGLQKDTGVIVVLQYKTKYICIQCNSLPRTEDCIIAKHPQNQTNSIGVLQEMSVHKGWRLPEYSVSVEAGPPHKKEFTVTCKVEAFTEMGTGSSKKVAKRIAAEKMLAKLQSLSESCVISMVLLKHQNFHTFSSLQMPKTTGFRLESLRNSSAEKITMLKRNPLSIPNTDYVQMMADLCEEQGFEITYLNIDELTVNGQYQCLAELATSPAIVCHGTGITCGNAHNDAAHSALQYVKIVAGTN
ncbi:PRKAA kinase, partial [Atractosteus spatula]|nr:PRKAA kinase [Atractosteus spatula]